MREPAGRVERRDGRDREPRRIAAHDEQADAVEAALAARRAATRIGSALERVGDEALRARELVAAAVRRRRELDARRVPVAARPRARPASRACRRSRCRAAARASAPRCPRSGSRSRPGRASRSRASGNSTRPASSSTMPSSRKPKPWPPYASGRCTPGKTELARQPLPERAVEARLRLHPMEHGRRRRVLLEAAPQLGAKRLLLLAECEVHGRGVRWRGRVRPNTDRAACACRACRSGRAAARR